MQAYSNFITPPDFVKDDFPTVLIIDADWNHIDSIALWCKTAPVSLNIYIYIDIMLDEEWLVNAINQSKTIIMNTESSAIDHIKKQLLKADNVWYYGPHTFLGNPRKIQNPLDWFVTTHV
jgi:hypothetical protein